MVAGVIGDRTVAFSRASRSRPLPDAPVRLLIPSLNNDRCRRCRIASGQVRATVAERSVVRVERAD